MRNYTALLTLIAWISSVFAAEASTVTVLLLTTTYSTTTVPSLGSNGALKGTLYVDKSAVRVGSSLSTSTRLSTSLLMVETIIPVVLTSTYVTTITTDRAILTTLVSQAPSNGTTISSTASSNAGAPTAIVTITQNPSSKQSSIVIGIAVPVFLIIIAIIIYLILQRKKKVGKRSSLRGSLSWMHRWPLMGFSPTTPTGFAQSLPLPPPIPHLYENGSVKQDLSSAPIRPTRPASLSPSLIEAMKDIPRGSYLHEMDPNGSVVPFKPISPTDDQIPEAVSSPPRVTAYEGSHKLFYEEASQRKLPFNKFFHQELPDREITPEPLRVTKKSYSDTTPFVTNTEHTAKAPASNTFPPHENPASSAKQSTSGAARLVRGLKQLPPRNLHSDFKMGKKTAKASGPLTELDSKPIHEKGPQYLDSDEEGEVKRDQARAKSLMFLEGGGNLMTEELFKRASSIYSREENGDPNPSRSQLIRERKERDLHACHAQRNPDLNRPEGVNPGEGFF